MVDLHGSFQSGMPLYWELFGDVPRVHYLAHAIPKVLSPKITACIMPLESTNLYAYIETLNFDTQGTLFGMAEGKELRIYNEHDEKDLEVLHNTFSDYLETITYSIYSIQTNIPVIVRSILDQWIPGRPLWIGTSEDQPIG
jgi:hypothetical protein